MSKKGTKSTEPSFQWFSMSKGNKSTEPSSQWVSMSKREQNQLKQVLNSSQCQKGKKISQARLL